MGQEHLDERAGACLIAETAAGQRPERFVVGAERAARPGTSQGSGTE